ncbi:MAG TPA: hypothetical protein VKV95_07245 [Terriglobia bacterium]|nr:hypothetical protein [Terriglobia bacterium]
MDARQVNELESRHPREYGFSGCPPKYNFRAKFLSLCIAAFAIIPQISAQAQPPQPKEKPAATYTIPLPPLPDFSQLNWLMGEWSGKTGDQKSQGDIHLKVSYDLEKRVAVFRESVSLPGTKTNPEITETWMGILTADRPGAGYSLRVFSSTGFVTRYRVTVEGAEIQFNPEGGEQPPPGWLFRRKLTRTDTDALTETVQVAPPQKPFFDYFTAKLTRAQPEAAKSK